MHCGADREWLGGPGGPVGIPLLSLSFSEQLPCSLPLLEMVACPHWSLPACSLWVTLNTDRSFKDKKSGWSMEELLFACRMMVPY